MRLSKAGIASIGALFLIIMGFVACGDFFPSTRQITSVSVTPTTAAVRPGAAQQFTATGVLGNNTTQDVTTQVTWSSSNVTIATVEPGTGMATGVAEGTATITAQASGSVKATASLFVTTIQSIAVTPENATVRVGESRQYTATATLENGTTRNVTNEVVWSVGDTNLASITAGGLLSPKSTGGFSEGTTVTAAMGSITDTVNVTISSL